jgi:hypothetical protein
MPGCRRAVVLNHSPAEFPVYSARLPHDTCGMQMGDDIPERIRYLGQQFREGVCEVEKIIGVKVRDEHVVDSIAIARCLPWKQTGGQRLYGGRT